MQFDFLNLVDIGIPSFGGAVSIEIPSPTSKVSNLLAVFESELGSVQMNMMKMAPDLEKLQGMSSFKDNDQKDLKKENDVIDGKAIINQLKIGGCNLPKCYDAFKKVLIESKSTFVCEKGDSVVTAVTVDRIPHKEFSLMLGEYFANFIVTSE